MQIFWCCCLNLDPQCAPAELKSVKTWLLHWALLTTGHVVALLRNTPKCGSGCCGAAHNKSKSAACHIVGYQLTQLCINTHWKVEHNFKVQLNISTFNINQNRSPPISRLKQYKFISASSLVSKADYNLENPKVFFFLLLILYSVVLMVTIVNILQKQHLWAANIQRCRWENKTATGIVHLTLSNRYRLHIWDGMLNAVHHLAP